MRRPGERDTVSDEETGRGPQRKGGAIERRFGLSPQRAVSESSRFGRDERLRRDRPAGHRRGEQTVEKIVVRARRRTQRIVVASRHDEQVAQVASRLRFVVAVRSVAFRTAFRTPLFRSEADAFAVVVMGNGREDQQQCAGQQQNDFGQPFSHRRCSVFGFGGRHFLWSAVRTAKIVNFIGNPSFRRNVRCDGATIRRKNRGTARRDAVLRPSPLSAAVPSFFGIVPGVFPIMGASGRMAGRCENLRFLCPMREKTEPYQRNAPRHRRIMRPPWHDWRSRAMRYGRGDVRPCCGNLFPGGENLIFVRAGTACGACRTGLSRRESRFRRPFFLEEDCPAQAGGARTRRSVGIQKRKKTKMKWRGFI